MKNPAPVKFVVIGCGAITEQSCLPALSAIPGCEVVSLVDSNLLRARSLAERYKVAHFSQTTADIPSTAEAAIVALPNILHAPVSCELMKTGLHVFCEKPMATTEADAQAMIGCAHENGVILDIGHVRRFFWCNRKVKEIIQSRELGDLISFQIEDGFVQDWPTASGFFFEKQKSGGGVFMDLGSHIIDLILWWLQDYPTEIVYQHDDLGGVEAECFLDLCFGKSVSGSLSLSRLMKLSGTYMFRFEGGSASFQPHDPGGLCNAVTIDRNGKKTLLKPKKARTFLDYFKEQLEAFIRSIRTGSPPPVPGESIVPSIRLIDESYRNATRLESPWLDSGLNKPVTQVTDDALDLRKLKILVTGASGFIGGRIVERLNLQYGNSPRCLVRNFNKMARLSRFPNEIAVGDLLDYDSLLRATEGCDVVIHCAYGSTRDEVLDRKITTAGTRNLVLASLQNKVKKFVHLSSIEIYGKNQPPLVNEETSPNFAVFSYGNDKLEAEKICLSHFRENSLPVVILRLSAVYGPYAPWTVDVINRLKSRGFCKSEKFNGICNPLYIDDCVDAIFLATARDGILGETFVISGGEKLSWNDYFVKYNEILDMPPLRTAGMLELRFYQIARDFWDACFKYLKPKYGPDLVFRYNSLRETGRVPNLKAFLQRGSLLTALEIYSRQTYYSIEKARLKLGFEPKHDFETGLLRVKEWLIHRFPRKQSSEVMTHSFVPDQQIIVIGKP